MSMPRPSAFTPLALEIMTGRLPCAAGATAGSPFVTASAFELGENHAFRRAGFLVRIVVGPPLLPGLRVVAKRLAGDEAKRAIYPAARVGVERIVIEKIQQIGNRGEALFAGEHSGFSDADRGALPHARRARKSSDFIAVSTRPNRRSVFCRRPRQLSAFWLISSSEAGWRRIARASSCSACCCGPRRVSSANSALTASAVGCDVAVTTAFAISPVLSLAQTALRRPSSKPAAPANAARTRNAKTYPRKRLSVRGRGSPQSGLGRADTNCCSAG